MKNKVHGHNNLLCALPEETSAAIVIAAEFE